MHYLNMKRPDILVEIISLKFCSSLKLDGVQKRGRLGMDPVLGKFPFQVFDDITNQQKNNSNNCLHPPVEGKANLKYVIFKYIFCGFSDDIPHTQILIRLIARKILIQIDTVLHPIFTIVPQHIRGRGDDNTLRRDQSRIFSRTKILISCFISDYTQDGKVV